MCIVPQPSSAVEEPSYIEQSSEGLDNAGAAVVIEVDMCLRPDAERSGIRGLHALLQGLLRCGRPQDFFNVCKRSGDLWLHVHRHKCPACRS